MSDEYEEDEMYDDEEGFESEDDSSEEEYSEEEYSEDEYEDDSSNEFLDEFENLTGISSKISKDDLLKGLMDIANS